MRTDILKTGSRLVENGYRGFNIYYFDTKYFALRQGDGQFDIAMLHARRYGTVFIGHTLEDVKREVDLICPEAGEQGLRKSVLKKERALFLCMTAPEKAEPLLGLLSKNYEITLLAANDGYKAGAGLDIIQCEKAGRAAPWQFVPGDVTPGLSQRLKAAAFDVVIVPYDRESFWMSAHPEIFAAGLTNRLLVAHPDGNGRLYKGEEIHRVIYNKSYLNSMFRRVPGLKGKKILEVGCSDGLVCDLILNEGPEAVTGIDLLETTGCGYNDPRIKYYRMDGSLLEFEDRAFDLCISIATLEHCKDPLKVLNEMKRAAKKGGYCYIQAGPLYFSPFGHHMFGFYDNFPWIHLRRSRDEIIEYSAANGIDEKILKNRKMDLKEYVYGMINGGHINGKRFSEYGLDGFMESKDIEVIQFSRSFEGENLLDAAILGELNHINKDDLTAHGFELLFRVR